jgi:hypothetical protein
MGRISFKINFRNQIVTVSVKRITFLLMDNALEIVLNNGFPIVNPAAVQYKKHNITQQHLNF